MHTIRKRIDSLSIFFKSIGWIYSIKVSTDSTLPVDHQSITKIKSWSYVRSVGDITDRRSPKVHIEMCLPKFDRIIPQKYRMDRLHQSLNRRLVIYLYQTIGV